MTTERKKEIENMKPGEYITEEEVMELMLEVIKNSSSIEDKDNKLEENLKIYRWSS